MPRPRKPEVLHRLEGTWRADRHANWGSVDREYERNRREAAYLAQHQEAAEPADYLDDAVEDGTTTDTFWQRELVIRSLSVRELAEASGVSYPATWRIVRGRRPGRPSTQRRLVAGLREFEVIFEAEEQE